MADKLKSKVENFINGDDNTMAWIVKGISGDKITIGDDDDTLFNIVVVDNGKYKIETSHDLLSEDFKTTMNKYTSQGTKDIEDVLIKAVDVYNSILGGDDDDDAGGDDDDEQEEVEIEIDDADLMKGDDDVVEETPKSKSAFSQQDIEEFKKRFPSRGKSEGAVNCIMTEYLKLKHNDTKKYGFSAEPCGDDIFTWEVRLFGFDLKEDEVAKDLVDYNKKYGQDYIQMEMKFTEGFPLEPPFIRVIKPRFKFRTGHVTIGGSICMQLLTKSGWSPVNTIESIFVQIRCEIASGGARLDFDNVSAYTEHEAREAYHRVAARYGWDNPNAKQTSDNFDH